MYTAARWKIGALTCAALTCAALALGSCSLLFSETQTAADAGGLATDARQADAGHPDARDSAEPLRDEGLLVRYYFDDDNMVILQAADRNPDNSLTMSDGVQVGGAAGRRGLQWQMASTAGNASAALVQNAMGSLDGQTAFTIELVLDLEDAGPEETASTLVYFASGSNPTNNDFALRTYSTGMQDFSIEFLFGGGVTHSWLATGIGSRSVLHLVFDSSQEDAVDRLMLFSNGALLPPTGTTRLEPDVSPTFADSSTVVIGNSPHTNEGSIAGRMGYFAVYNEALGQDGIAGNAATLGASDDPAPSGP